MDGHLGMRARKKDWARWCQDAGHLCRLPRRDKASTLILECDLHGSYGT